mmetsp:Transcript_18392/g.73479  ORF Transcript_18392/g.73479 Transcript_18392/m.73479 type:complete len:107 (+) Transcript_18392:1361-1681(+)
MRGAQKLYNMRIANGIEHPFLTFIVVGLVGGHGGKVDAQNKLSSSALRETETSHHAAEENADDDDDDDTATVASAETRPPRPPRRSRRDARETKPAKETSSERVPK